MALYWPNILFWTEFNHVTRITVKIRHKWGFIVWICLLVEPVWMTVTEILLWCLMSVNAHRRVVMTLGEWGPIFWTIGTFFLMDSRDTDTKCWQLLLLTKLKHIAVWRTGKKLAWGAILLTYSCIQQCRNLLQTVWNTVNRKRFYFDFSQAKVTVVRPQVFNPFQFVKR